MSDTESRGNWGALPDPAAPPDPVVLAGGAGSGSTGPGPVVGYCRACGRALDAAAVRAAHGTIYCAEHAPAIGGPAAGTSGNGAPGNTAQATPPPFPGGASPGGAGMGPGAAGPASAFQSPYASPYGSPYTTPYATSSSLGHHDGSPGLAFLLGLIPGVGAVYNGQYAKGLVHVVIVGLLISILSNGAAEGLEALLGLLLAAFWAYMAFEAFHTAKKKQLGQPVDEFSSVLPGHGGTRFPAAPIVVITLGVVFLLSNLQILEFRRLLRYWPVLMIALGVYMLFGRMAGEKPRDPK